MMHIGEKLADVVFLSIWSDKRRFERAPEADEGKAAAAFNFSDNYTPIRRVDYLSVFSFIFHLLLFKLLSNKMLFALPNS